MELLIFDPNKKQNLMPYIYTLVANLSSCTYTDTMQAHLAFYTSLKNATRSFHSDPIVTEFLQEVLRHGKTFENFVIQRFNLNTTQQPRPNVLWYFNPSTNEWSKDFVKQVTQNEWKKYLRLRSNV